MRASSGNSLEDVGEGELQIGQTGQISDFSKVACGVNCLTARIAVGKNNDDCDVNALVAAVGKFGISESAMKQAATDVGMSGRTDMNYAILAGLQTGKYYYVVARQTGSSTIMSHYGSGSWTMNGFTPASGVTILYSCDENWTIATAPVAYDLYVSNSELDITATAWEKDSAGDYNSNSATTSVPGATKVGTYTFASSTWTLASQAP